MTVEYEEVWVAQEGTEERVLVHKETGATVVFYDYPDLQEVDVSTWTAVIPEEVADMFKTQADEYLAHSKGW